MEARLQRCLFIGLYSAVSVTASLNRTAAFSPSIKALIPLFSLFIQRYTGSLLLLGNMGHWKISDTKVFMRRYSQLRGSRVQILCTVMCQYLDTLPEQLYLSWNKKPLPAGSLQRLSFFTSISLHLLVFRFT